MREQLKKEAELVAAMEGFNWQDSVLADLIARQDAYIDGLEVQLTDVESSLLEMIGSYQLSFEQRASAAKNAIALLRRIAALTAPEQLTKREV